MRYAFWISTAIAVLCVLRGCTSDDSGIYSSLNRGSDPAGNALMAGMAVVIDLFTFLGAALAACIFLFGPRMNPGALRTLTLAFGWLVFAPVALVGLVLLLETPAVVRRMGQKKQARAGLTQRQHHAVYERFLEVSKLTHHLYEDSDLGESVRSQLGEALLHVPPEKRDEVGALLMSLQPKTHSVDSTRVDGYPRDLLGALGRLTLHPDPDVSRRAEEVLAAMLSRESEYCRRVSSGPCPGP